MINRPLEPWSRRCRGLRPSRTRCHFHPGDRQRRGRTRPLPFDARHGNLRFCSNNRRHALLRRGHSGCGNLNDIAATIAAGHGSGQLLHHVELHAALGALKLNGHGELLSRKGAAE
jgi:hypothetical protein